MGPPSALQTRAPPPGAGICRVWAPQDVWERISIFLRPASAQSAFAATCASAAAAVARARAPAHVLLRHNFRLCAFALPHDIMNKVRMVHVVPPRGEGLVLFVDESDLGDGVELAWLKHGILRRIPLGLEAVPATAVSNIRFSPDGCSLALLVTLANGSVVHPETDPLRRLRGWETSRIHRATIFDIQHDPCEDCTVQVVDFCQDDTGCPTDLVLHTFSHVFVPEYGFDMVWRPLKQNASSHEELAFAAMLHSESGAATYLVRWRSLRTPDADNYIFMACIEGASMEFLEDKRKAMIGHPSTICTSRIEIADDAKHIFFDTISKFGILRFDQVDDATTSKVTRADLTNGPTYPWRSLSPGKICLPSTRSREVAHGPGGASIDMVYPSVPWTDQSMRSVMIGCTRVSRMSPDGTLLCSLVSPCHQTAGSGFDCLQPKHIEMRSSATGRLMYRRVLFRSPDAFASILDIKVRLEKSSDIAQHTLLFSDDSSLLVVWDTLQTYTHCIVLQRLPVVMDATTGSVIQEFGPLSSGFSYEGLQISPDAETVYGTRMDDDKIKMDAIDMVSGSILKTVTLTGRVHPPEQFSNHSIYLLPNRRLHAVSRGSVDVLWDTTRGSLGCGWRSHPRDDGCGRQ